MADWISMIGLGVVIVPMLVGIGKKQGNVETKLDDMKSKLDDLKKLPEEVQRVREGQIIQGAIQAEHSRRLDALEASSGRRRTDSQRRPIRYYDRP